MGTLIDKCKAMLLRDGVCDSSHLEGNGAPLHHADTIQEVIRPQDDPSKLRAGATFQESESNSQKNPIPPDRFTYAEGRGESPPLERFGKFHSIPLKQYPLSIIVTE